ncbi:MAG: transposase [Chloroflexota bacterium]|nr:transposase [Chloroflexota bacterium]
MATPVDLWRPTRLYAVRTPSEEKPGGMHYAVLVTTLELEAQEAVEAYDARAGIENDFKGDKQGLGLRARRKRKQMAQEMVVLLAGLAHNLLLWARMWLANGDPRLGKLGIVRLVREVWAVPGRLTFSRHRPTRVRLARSHPLGPSVKQGLGALLKAVSCPSIILGYSG